MSPAGRMPVCRPRPLVLDDLPGDLHDLPATDDDDNHSPAAPEAHDEARLVLPLTHADKPPPRPPARPRRLRLVRRVRRALNRRPRPPPRPATAALALAVLLLLGSIIVLGTVWAFFHADPRARLTPAEIALVDPSFHWTDPRLAIPPRPHAAQPVAPAHPPPSAAPPPPPPPPPPAATALPPHAAAPVAPATDYMGHFVHGQHNRTHPLRPGEHIPRLIHQTWKSPALPPKWLANSAACRAMHPDYDYILWTDEDARAFLAVQYPWFLPVFDAYPYNIQRADAIRYFVLHHYGGIYMDLDMGCQRPMDPLLHFQVVLPQTKPIGLSNDVMLAAPHHPFFDHTIHLLQRCSKNFLIPYMTVMFSTGPMFLSGAYGQFSRVHGTASPSTPDDLARGTAGVRILPQILYGKLRNPPPGLHSQPGAFYSHYYGSSWHAADATFVQALGNPWWLLIALAVGVAGLWAYRAHQARRSQTVWPSRSTVCPPSPWIEMG